MASIAHPKRLQFRKQAFKGLVLMLIVLKLSGSLHAQYQITYDITPVEGDTVKVTVTKASSSAPNEVIVNLLPGSALPQIPEFPFYDYTVDKKFSTVLVFDFNGEKETFTIPIHDDDQPEFDEDFTVRVTDAVKGLLLAELTLVIPANDASGTPQSLPSENTVPIPDLKSDFGEIRINTDKTPPVDSGWRFVGETEWRRFGEFAPQMLIDNSISPPPPHEVEFLPVPGHTIVNSAGSSSNPLGAQITLQEAGERLTFLIDYVPNSADKGNLTVEIFPNAAAKGSPPARWRIRHLDKDENGEDDPYVTGDTLTLPAGFYEVYFDELPGFEVPRPRIVQVIEYQENVIEATYLDNTAAGDSGKYPLTPIDYFETPFQLRGVQGTGQVRSNIAKATGVAVAERVVLTTAQAIFNPKRLTSSYKVRWSLQRQTTGVQSNKRYNPPVQIPRGWYLFNDYSSALEDLVPGDVSESSLDNSVAALFFTNPCAKGGFTGYLGSTTNEKLPKLTNPDLNKFFAGYGLSQITESGSQSGIDGILYVSPGGYSAALNPIPGTSLYAAPGLSNQTEVPLSSLTGSALFLRGSSIDIPGAILVGTRNVGKGEELIFRAIDVSVAALIHRASYSALTGNIYNTTDPVADIKSLQTPDDPDLIYTTAAGLGGGFGGTGGGTFGSEATTGSLVINLDPSGAVTQGARWGQSSGGDANLESGAQVDGLIAGEYYNLTYSDASGYKAPTDTAYTIVSEQTTRDTKDYSLNSYTLSYDAEGGAVSPSSKSVTFNSTYGSLPTPTRTGYTFGGWWDGDNGTGTQIFSDTTVTTASNHTIYARWSINQYTIFFNSNGGSAVVSIMQDYNTDITPPTDPTLTGYTFDGWSPAIPATMPANNLTVTAQWIENATPEDVWLGLYFNETELANPDIVGPTANPDGDPYKNAVERALGGNPMSSEDLINLSASPSGLSIRIEPDTRQTDMTLSIYVGSSPSAASGKGTIGARSNQGMTDWPTKGEGISVKNNGDRTWTIQDTNPGGSRFMYIEATSANP